MKNRINSFPPVADSSAKILILGSMPGEASLQTGQYYAHPRNAFWKIMAEIIGFKRDMPYKERLQALKQSGIALWDVMHSCHRKGSLDSAIEIDSIEVNDFETFFAAHPGIRLVCFNGAAAEQCYKKHALRNGWEINIPHIRLPSTSPAHASLSSAEKIEVWKAAINLETSKRLA